MKFFFRHLHFRKQEYFVFWSDLRSFPFLWSRHWWLLKSSQLWKLLMDFLITKFRKHISHWTVLRQWCCKCLSSVKSVLNKAALSRLSIALIWWFHPFRIWNISTLDIHYKNIPEYWTCRINQPFCWVFKIRNSDFSPYPEHASMK